MRLELPREIKSFVYLFVLSASWRIVMQEGKRKGALAWRQPDFFKISNISIAIIKGVEAPRGR
jgi:hypothetical protein